MPFLGQIVNKRVIAQTPNKIKAVAELQAPTNVEQLRRVLGQNLFAYYRKYIPRFAEIAAHHCIHSLERIFKTSEIPSEELP